MPRTIAPHDVEAIRRRLTEFLNSADGTGATPCNAMCGVYVFYDYDGEPIYVGQTHEQLRVRIQRHITNQRTDAVAMNVLDPFEVADIEVYPLYDLEEERPGETGADFKARKKARLSEAEYTVFQRVLTHSKLKAVLNEKDIASTPLIELPPAFRGRIIPPELYETRRHPDVRIERRASTIARLAKVIRERHVSPGLRRTLLTQARRLELLARSRFDEAEGSSPARRRRRGK